MSAFEVSEGIWLDKEGGSLGKLHIILFYIWKDFVRFWWLNCIDLVAKVFNLEKFR